jgi:DNA-binding NarL/FixJ family response regulator
VRGASNQRIAGELACALHTVEVHVSRILAKADVASRTELIAQIVSGDA